jgi:hypothetical protein
MERRVVLKSLAVVVAGVVFIPGCDLSNKPSGGVVEAFLSPSQNELLADIVEAFIPATDTPGAKELKVHSYIKIMVIDCQEPEVQKLFLEGLHKLDEGAKERFGKGFSALTIPQQFELLRMLESSAEASDAAFYTLLKGLTIQGFMTSEYVMSNHTGYQMVPGYYYGCVPVKQNL